MRVQIMKYVMIVIYLKLRSKCGLNYIVNAIILLNLASGTVPYPRAAHAAASSENNKLYVYGGAVMGNIKNLNKKFRRRTSFRPVTLT